MGDCLFYEEERFPFRLFVKGAALCVFIESPACALRHVDRARLINQKINKSAGSAAEAACAQPARGVTLTLFQSKVIVPAINLIHLAFASYILVNSFYERFSNSQIILNDCLFTWPCNCRQHFILG